MSTLELLLSLYPIVPSGGLQKVCYGPGLPAPNFTVPLSGPQNGIATSCFKTTSPQKVCSQVGSAPYLPLFPASSFFLMSFFSFFSFLVLSFLFFLSSSFGPGPQHIAFLVGGHFLFHRREKNVSTGHGQPVHFDFSLSLYVDQNDQKPTAPKFGSYGHPSGTA